MPDAAAGGEPASVAFGAPVTRSTVRSLGPALIATVLLLAATVYDGAFDVRHWGPPAIFALLFLVVVVLAGGMRPLDRTSAVGLAAIWAYVAWDLLSAIWAPYPGAAIEGGARTAFYAAMVTVALVAIPGPREARRVGALVIGGITLIGAITLIRMHFDGGQMFVAGRLDAPVGYRNATACLFAMAFWPLLGVAASKSRNPSLRASSFSAAVLMLGLVFLTQSRGALVGLAIGGILALIIGPEWLRRPWLALLAGVGLLLLSGPLLAAHRAFEGSLGPVTVEDITTAADALIFLVFDALVVGVLFALLDGGLRASPEVMRRAKRLAAVGLVAGTVALIAGAIAVAGDPLQFIQEKISEFQKVPERGRELQQLISTGGERYDLWRVAGDEFAAHPIAGIGEGGYSFGYYEDRASARNLTDPHSLPLSLLAQTGLVGALLVATFLASLFYGVFSRAWGASLPARRAAAGLAGAAGVVVGQALVDWIWIVPGVMALGLYCLALAVVTVTPRPPVQRRLGSSSRRTVGLVRGLPAAGLLAAGLLVAALYIADFEVGEARGGARSAPLAALGHARTAEALTPWALTPVYLASGALEQAGRPTEAHRELHSALRLAPGYFVSEALLGDQERRASDRPAAHGRYRDAHQANPRDNGLRRLVKKSRPQIVKVSRRVARQLGVAIRMGERRGPEGFATGPPPAGG
ncbi:MAG: hypothetical protein QOG62_1721 [Thermoleophilaceae bacterium]|jgi:hypothetical protein|nr:hypothetical protein [Thermoleophilaceae bacterium]